MLSGKNFSVLQSNGWKIVCLLSFSNSVGMCLCSFLWTLYYYCKILWVIYRPVWIHHFFHQFSMNSCKSDMCKLSQPNFIIFPRLKTLVEIFAYVWCFCHKTLRKWNKCLMLSLEKIPEQFFLWRWRKTGVPSHFRWALDHSFRRVIWFSSLK